MEAPWLTDHSWWSCHVSQVYFPTVVALQEQLCLPRLCCCHSSSKVWAQCWHPDWEVFELPLCPCVNDLWCCGSEARQESISYTTVKMKWTDCFLFLFTGGCGHNKISTLGWTGIFHSIFPQGAESTSWLFVCCHSKETQYYTLGKVTVCLDWLFEGTGPLR